ncbi:hypothetical protein CLV80_107189 [Yoonia maritima]|uniref:Uncharacterized protein n=1 Tax=Yoonia maritima TaxID=1435347 RepID=A0A2T0VXY1_9RHOB|nr:hypothetical protein [Yoonia maritima]PRY77011.1 hypothetical protein CLV80_107189 [Yoonia maritima]
MGRAPNLPIGTVSDDTIFKGDIILVDRNNIQRLRIDSSTGSVRVRDADGNIVFHTEFPGANLRLGGNGRDGDVVVFPRSATDIADVDQASIHLNGDAGVIRAGGGQRSGKIVCVDADDNQALLIDADEAAVIIGGNGRTGRLVVHDDENKGVFFADGKTGNVIVGGPNQEGDLHVRNAQNKTTVRLDGNAGNLILGGDDQDGDLIVRRSGSETALHINGRGNELILNNNVGNPAVILNAGIPENTTESDANGVEMSGRIEVLSKNDRRPRSTLGTTHDDGGSLSLFDNENRLGLSFNGERASIDVGGSGKSGNIFVSNGDGGDDAIRLHGSEARLVLGSGAGNVSGKIEVHNSSGEPTIFVNGEAGDIVLPNGDVAELFDPAPGAVATITSGVVVILNSVGQLEPCSQVADIRVAGIVAGAGKTRPAVVMGTALAGTDAVPLALVGRAWVQADADSAGAIRPGDIMTTSTTTGHAERASSPATAAGAIIGKALGPLENGQGLIPVLIMLR